MNPAVAIAASAIAGIIASTNFAPWDVPGTMLLAVAVWWWLLACSRHGRALRIVAMGVAFGAGFMGPLIWWMNAVDPWAWFALTGAQALFYALIALALRAVQRLAWWPLWAAAVWTVGETLRGAVPFSGFPWGRLVHTAIDTPLAPWVRLLGMAGTSALMALCAGLLVVAATRPRRAVPAAAAVLAVLITGALLPVGIAGAGETYRVAVVQGGTPGPFLQWRTGEIFALHLAATRSIDEPVDMVLWPENATDVDPFQRPWAADALDQAVEQVGAPILVGGILDGPTPTTAYNAGLVWHRHGPGDTYLKRQLVPYGEYVPFRQQLGDLVPRFDRDIPRDMVPGEEPGAVRIGGAVIGDTICWDIAYDRVVADAVAAGADFLVVQTSNASFEGTSQLRQQWNISRLRAVETGRYVVVPSTNGISGVVDPRGRVVSEAPLIEPAVLIETIRAATGRTPAQSISAPLEWGVAGLASVMVLWGWRRGRR